MKTPDISIINQTWPDSELEYVDACPYCGSIERTIAYKNLQDKVFYCTPGMWTSWDCKVCESFYLSPRPTEASIGRAYARYYTHDSSNSSLKKKIKTRLKNECFSHWLNENINPRINIPRYLSFLLLPLKKIIFFPFELERLVSLTKGKLLDVGCGNGDMLKVAKELGWDVTGLEIDSNAVKAAREEGLYVIEGNYSILDQFDGSFDCIVCSHVLEHVHHPLVLLELITKALKSKGTLFLSLPNAKSHVRQIFGENWRGTETPRHLGIPTIDKLKECLINLNFTDIVQSNVYDVTTLESVRIKESKLSLGLGYFIYLKIKNVIIKKTAETPSDFIQLTARKK